MEEESVVTVVASEENHKGLPALIFTREQLDLIKRTIAKGSTDDELALFLYTAKRTGLDPLTRQIHAVKRFDSSQNREVMAVQIAIDGYRLVADRTGKYAPGREPSFEADKNGNIVSATAYIKKFAGGEWHEVAATAFFSEYSAKKKDGGLTKMWAERPRTMLAKCAEALAIRKAFPAELSGTYTPDEMEHAGEERPATPAIKGPEAKPATKPEAKAEPKAEPKAEGEDSITFIPVSSSSKPDKNGKERFAVKNTGDVWYSTYDPEIGAAILAARENKTTISLVYKTDGDFNNIVRLG